eukprot:TRINITY_DN9590_c0_g1_i1.p1 TRINITY_DN9590_c0_g1~~TRINITY_DN9590_c0_g1_i1.p1  ORF type:complete len:793 (-),score=277.42 TRINITY_DN9590_c0_g1_i1:161-2539(-)
MFSKSKPRHPLSICADCGSSSPSWASVNRGVLICSDCCSVHRSLGRHISHVKCLKHGTWIPEQLTMVQSLYSCGANSIWEYSLLNPASSKSGKRKPQAGDPVHPTKSDFIRAKHQLLSYVFKPAKDDLQITESDLSKQLHSSVRTPNLETSLRLLSQGADPNYFHPEKNSTPLAVAARAGQVCQVELLLVYGADPAAVDLAGKTASEHARTSGFLPLATRIHNAQFELSDRLSFFLCGRRPEHGTNKHYLIPELGGTVVGQGEPAKVARRKMTGLSNKVFEELAVDVYDEVDRRETDALWNKIETGGSQASVLVPFLPVNPDYSATRNQGRQKLARLTPQEFSALVVDVLKEVRRRQVEIDSARGVSTTAVKYSPSNELSQTLTKLNLSSTLGCRASTLSDDEPLYDSVASDDDYYIISDKDELLTRQQARLREQQMINTRGTSQMVESRAGSACSATTTLQRSKSLAAADRDIQSSTEFSVLKEQLECSEKKVQALIASNDDMRTELAKLQSTVQRLVHDNKEFQRASLSPSHTSHTSHTSHESPQHSGPAHSLLRGEGAGYTDGRAGSPLASHGSPLRSPQSPGSRSHSMYEYREGRTGSTSGPTSLPGPGTSYMAVGTTGSPRNYPAARRDSYDQTGGRFATAAGYSDSGTHSLPYSFQNTYGDATVYQEVLPSQEEVVRRTEAITRCIQELLISAKDEQFDSFIPCSERIVRAVTDMVLLFPEEPGHSAVSASLSSLTAAATHFETECRMLILRSQREPLNQNFVTQQVIQCAFDIAKATKQLVALFQ